MYVISIYFYDVYNWNQIKVEHHIYFAATLARVLVQPPSQRQGPNSAALALQAWHRISSLVALKEALGWSRHGFTLWLQGLETEMKGYVSMLIRNIYGHKSLKECINPLNNIHMGI